MTGSPEAVRFLELLPLEFIMASVLGLFYTLLNGGSNSPAGKCNPPGEYTPLCAVTPTNTHTQTSRTGSPFSIRFGFPFMHLHVYILQCVGLPPSLFFFFCLFPAHTQTQLYNLYRSQRMEVRHPPQRKLRVSACSAQPNHKSCQATLVSAHVHTYRHTHSPSFLLCRFEYKRGGFGDYRGASLFLFFSIASFSTCCFHRGKSREVGGG